jgi:hypothetical protein
MKNRIKFIIIIIIILATSFATINAQILTENELGVVVLDVEAPNTVELGGTINVNVTIEYNFPTEIEIKTGIWDHSIQDFIEQYNQTVNGYNTIEYEFILVFREDIETGTYTFDANVLYKLGEEFYHLESNWMKSFEIDVVDAKPRGFEIPSYPIEAIIIGLAAYIVFFQFKKR